ncbi:isochorismatase family cysteine hydrolase [Pseudomonas sp.]|uniref:isochorismatase family cysteine hydrolase n=1 Tax=Pseudomonas sp. TaxID=306 RepID=UPI002F40342B
MHFKGKRSADGVGYAERSPLNHGRSAVQGEWGAQIIKDFSVAASDICVNKHRLSGFWDTELDSLLRANGITTLLFAGINTDRCVFSTLQDAAFLGYDCILLADACSTPSPTYVTRAIHFLVEQCHGFIASAVALQSSLTHRQES